MRRCTSQRCYGWLTVAKTFVGSRVRQLRSERGFSQAALAQMLEISPSYLNQIEHDVRPLTVAVLLRITEVFGVDATFFASEDDTRLVAELREVTLDRDVAIDVDLAEVADMVGSHPALARAMVNLHRRYRLTTAQLAAATEDRHSDGSGSGAITMPHEEVRDYFYQRQNYLHELDTAAEDLTIRMRMHRAELARELADRLTRVHGVHIKRRIDLGGTVLHRYDPASKTLEISDHLSSGQTVFKMAAELAYLEFGDLIDKLVGRGQLHQRGVHACWPGWGWRTTSRPQRCCRTGSFTMSRRTSAMTSNGSRRSTRSPTRRSRTGCRRCSARPCGVCRCRSSAWTAQETCQSDSPPRAFTSPPAAAPARCGTSTRRSPTRARSACRSRRCPTDATTCGWPARSSAAPSDTASRVRRSRSASAANYGMRTGWSTRRGWTCRATTRRRSARAVASASATTARSGPSPRWAAHWTSTNTAARCRPIWSSSPTIDSLR